MSRKKKNKPGPSPVRDVIPFPSRPPAPGTTLPFAPGTPVRVKAGVRDPDFPELDLGGWTATVLEMDGDAVPRTYLLAWTPDTLAEIDPTWLHRWEREGMEFDTIWLDETELEADPDRPMQDPAETHFAPPGVKEIEEMEARLRTALGLAPGEPMLFPGAETLRTYRQFLTTQLTFPLGALYHGGFLERMDDPEPVALIGLAPEIDDHEGLIAVVLRGEREERLPLWQLAVLAPAKARELVQDYALWFFTSRIASQGQPSLSSFVPGQLNPRANRHPVWNAVKAGMSYGAGLGAPTGALLATLDDKAQYGMWGGMAVVGLIGYLAGSRYGHVFGLVNRIRFGHLYGGIFGLLGGAMLGTVIGVMIMGALGTIPGCIAGSLLGAAFQKLGWEPIGRNAWTPLGGCIGGLVYATIHNSQQALTGALAGAATGAILVAVVVMMLLVTLGLAGRSAG